jgi:hypothetical protein
MAEKQKKHRFVSNKIASPAIFWQKKAAVNSGLECREETPNKGKQHKMLQCENNISPSHSKGRPSAPARGPMFFRLALLCGNNFPHRSSPLVYP